MKALWYALYTISIIAAVNFSLELISGGSDWISALDLTILPLFAIVVFALLVKGELKSKPTEKQLHKMFDKFESSGIKLGICENCGGELILEIQDDTPLETLVEYIASLSKCFDLTFSNREGELYHFKIG